MPRTANELCPGPEGKKGFAFFPGAPADRREEKAPGMAPTGGAGGPEARNRMLRAVGGVVFAVPAHHRHMSKNHAKGSYGMNAPKSK
jgi:hypothetical protein